MPLHAEANEVDGQPFTRSIFELAQLTDISPVRISALLDQLADADAIGYAPLNGDARTVTVEVL
ncbi:MAG TPA: hypothetical protein VMP86_07705 [Candidatus Binatia bacterium]|nr:hypothetical protein [Candidatus Binatia bacterium]